MNVIEPQKRENQSESLIVHHLKMKYKFLFVNQPTTVHKGNTAPKFELMYMTVALSFIKGLM